MTSQIDVTKPIFGTPTTQSVRDNFTIAANEISLLQQQTVGSPFLPLSGGRMTGPMYLHNDPTDAMMPATKGYVDAGGAGAGGGIPEAPPDGQTYGRSAGAWQAVLPLVGGTLLGALILAADPTGPFGAVTKQYADAIKATIIADAPNDTNTYGRHANAWAGVLPIAGGQLTGSLGVGRPIPATAQVGSLLSVQVTAGSHMINAYADTSGNTHYRAAGTAMAFGQYGSNAAIYVAPTGAADAAFTFPVPPIQFDALGNLIMPGATAIPTDTALPWISGAEFVSTAGHYAFNCYVPTPSTNWKYLTAGYCAQFYQDRAGGTVTLNVSQSSGAAGGVMGSSVAFGFYPSGNFYLTGIISAGHAILATASAGNAFVGSYTTGGTPTVLGMWNGSNALYFGNADGNGNPQTTRMYIDANSNLTVVGGVFPANVGVAFGLFASGNARLLQFGSSWSFNWDVPTGTLTWNTPYGALINARISPDYLVWNAVGAMGGNGAYVNISDDRAKQDIAAATVGLTEVLQLVPINFTRIPHQAPDAATMEDGSPVSEGSHAPEIGFSAQQVRPIIPEAVVIVGSPLPDGTGGLDTDPTLAIHDTAILAAAINAIKDIHARLVARGI